MIMKRYPEDFFFFKILLLGNLYVNMRLEFTRLSKTHKFY